jgi:hypothetical protein
MSAASADRNLLFGILAVQLDFIDKDGLITKAPACLPISVVCATNWLV